jgi:hypothetical protein
LFKHYYYLCDQEEASLLSFLKTMKLIILEQYDQVSEWAAKYVRNKILLFNPGPERYFTLGLPTGKPLLEQTTSYHTSSVIKRICYGDDRAVGLTEHICFPTAQVEHHLVATRN